MLFFNKVKSVYLLPTAEKVVIFLGAVYSIMIKSVGFKKHGFMNTIMRFLHYLLMLFPDSVFQLYNEDYIISFACLAFSFSRFLG